MCSSLKNHNSGAALIMALLLVAIVAAISTTIMFSQQVDIQRAILKDNADQAFLDASYVPLWMHHQLTQLIQQRNKQKKLPSWPQIMPAKTMSDGAHLDAQFYPANARFNINNLAQPVSQYMTLFTNLIQVVDPRIKPKEAQKLTQNVQLWLLKASQGQQVTNPYAKMTPAYQAAHQPMLSASELRLVNGISADLYKRLQAYIIALPETNVKIDVNAASETLLTALLGQNQTAADSVVQYRNDSGGFLNTGLFLGLRLVAPYNQSQSDKASTLSQIITASMPEYYLVHSQVKNDKMLFNFFSILKFSPKTKTISVIQQGQSL